MTFEGIRYFSDQNLLEQQENLPHAIGLRAQEEGHTPYISQNKLQRTHIWWIIGPHEWKEVQKSIF